MAQNSRTVAVIGGGTMGASIAALFAAHGWTVHMASRQGASRATLAQRLESAMRELNAPYDTAHFALHDHIHALPWESVDVAFEAVVEELEVKLQVFEEMMKISRANTPLCSASAGIEIDRIGERLPTRERMLGARFGVPAHLADGIALVCSTYTRKAIADRVANIFNSIGKPAARVSLGSGDGPTQATDRTGDS